MLITYMKITINTAKLKSFGPAKLRAACVIHNRAFYLLSQQHNPKANKLALMHHNLAKECDKARRLVMLEILSIKPARFYTCGVLAVSEYFPHSISRQVARTFEGRKQTNKQTKN